MVYQWKIGIKTDVLSAEKYFLNDLIARTEKQVIW